MIKTSSPQKIGDILVKLVFLLVYLFPLFLSLKSILNGSIPFWYDNARDLLLALDNLKKPTLIGPPSGIPGIFYGPYWIWLLSGALSITRDPRFITFFLQLIPYFTIFPFLLFRFAQVFGKRTMLILWFLFIFAYQNYTTFLWHPHMAPLFYLFLVYLGVFTDFSCRNSKTYTRLFIWGFVGGLLMLFHVSFGLAMLIGSFLFIIFESGYYHLPKKKTFKISSLIYFLFSFCLGIFFSLVPFFVFEFRHNFLQVRAIWKAVTNAILYNSASVGQTGLSSGDILNSFFLSVPAKLLNISPHIFFVLAAVSILFIVYRGLPKKLSLSEEKKKLLRFLLICSISILYLYISSKNPVWDYHFIGVEIIYLLLLGIIIEQFSLVRSLIFLWTGVIFLSSVIHFFKSVPIDPYSISTLSTKEHIVDLVYKDAGSSRFSVFVYSGAIYTYDFDYLFQWLGNDKYGYIPGKESTAGEFVYLIIPKSPESIQLDFINYKTPNKQFRTVYQWVIPDGTTVVKRSSKGVL